MTLFTWFVLVMLASPSGAGQSAKAPAADPWAPIRFMVGSWRGDSSGQPGVGSTERIYRFEFGEMFLRAESKSIYPASAKNPKGEVHRDTSLFSFDKARNTLVLRQFHSEGFVNQYVVESPAQDGKPLAFVTEAIENIAPGWRARETYLVVGPDEFVEVFELAAPGKAFERYTECRFKRVKQP